MYSRERIFLPTITPAFQIICSVRALGETDINPVSGLGKISQLFFAYVQPGNVVANLLAGGIAEGKDRISEHCSVR